MVSFKKDVLNLVPNPHFKYNDFVPSRLLREHLQRKLGVNVNLRFIKAKIEAYPKWTLKEIWMCLRRDLTFVDCAGYRLSFGHSKINEFHKI